MAVIPISFFYPGVPTEVTLCVLSNLFNSGYAQNTDGYELTENVDLSITNPDNVEFWVSKDYLQGSIVKDNATGDPADPYYTFYCFQDTINQNRPGNPGITQWALLFKTSEGWQPIGTAAEPFTVPFYGNGFSINNMYVNRTSTSYVGFFGKYDSGIISDLNIIDATVYGSSYVGALAGIFGTSASTYVNKIQNCKSSGEVKGGNYAGGLVGNNTWALIENSSSSCNVSYNVLGTGDWHGGLIGANGGWCRYNYATGNVIGKERVGGLSGSNAGVAGSNRGIINDCYARGNVQSTISTPATVCRCGGLIGYCNDAPVTNSHSTGLVTSSGSITSIGGFIGEKAAAGSVITNCFYDTNTSGQSDNLGNGTPKTTDQMKTMSTFTNWNFTDIWSLDNNINDGYPYLSGTYSYLYYLFGGSNENSDNLDIVEYINYNNRNIVYNNSNEFDNTSLLLEKMPVPKHGVSSVYSNYNGNEYIYLIGGFTTAQKNTYIDIQII